MSDHLRDTLAALLGECRCLDAYKDRGLKDPQCCRCDLEDDAREIVEGYEYEIAAQAEEIEKLRAERDKSRAAADRMRAVLCGPDGRCCILGSEADREIVDAALEEIGGDYA